MLQICIEMYCNPSLKCWTGTENSSSTSQQHSCTKIMANKCACTPPESVFFTVKQTGCQVIRKQNITGNRNDQNLVLSCYSNNDSRHLKIYVCIFYSSFFLDLGNNKVDFFFVKSDVKTSLCVKTFAIMFCLRLLQKWKALFCIDTFVILLA